MIPEIERLDLSSFQASADAMHSFSALMSRDENAARMMALGASQMEALCDLCKSAEGLAIKLRDAINQMRDLRPSHRAPPGLGGDEALASEIREILGRYGVRTHWKASQESRSRKYAIWAKGPQRSEQVTEPTSHGEAHEQLSNLIVADLLEIIDREKGSE